MTITFWYNCHMSSLTYDNFAPATAFPCMKMTFRGVLLLLSFLIKWKKHSQIWHEKYSALEAFSILFLDTHVYEVLIFNFVQTFFLLTFVLHQKWKIHKMLKKWENTHKKFNNSSINFEIAPIFFQLRTSGYFFYMVEDNVP